MLRAQSHAPASLTARRAPPVAQLSSQPQEHTSSPESYLHVCQGGAEVLVNVGFEYRVKMLKLDVSYQGDDEDLPKVASVNSSPDVPPGPRFLTSRGLFFLHSVCGISSLLSTLKGKS